MKVRMPQAPVSPQSRALQKSLVALAVYAVVATAAAQQAPSGTSVAGTALEEVVVTTQRRQQKEEEVPISMAVVNSDSLEKSRSASLQQMQDLVPAFSMENQGGFDVLTVRGVGGGGRNIGFDPRVGVYLDGIFMGQAQALQQPLFDIDRVEVLRGPQGYLFGRNTVAGAVNITTLAPTNDFESTLRADVGSYGTLEGYGTLSGPISDGVLGRIAVASEQHDGFTTNLYNGEKLDNLRRLTARGELLFRPTDRLDVKIGGDVSTSQQKIIIGEPTTGLFGLPLAGGELPPRTVDFNTQPFADVNLGGGNVTANYKLDGGQVVTAIVGYRRTRQERQDDNDYTPYDLLWTYYVEDFKQSSEELRIASSNTGSVRYVFGLYNLREDANTNRTAYIGQDAGTALVVPYVTPGGQLIFLPFTVALGVQPGATVPSSGDVVTKTSAVYGELDYDIVKTLTLNLGARYTHETKDVLFNLDGSESGAFAIGTLVNYTDSRKEDRVSPSVGLTWAVAKDQNIYAKWSTGFKSGGWNMDFLSAAGTQNPAFNTETVESYELGAKGRLADGRIRYDLAAYTSTFNNFQVSEFVELGAGATDIELKNAAEAKSKGVEGSLTARVARDLDLGLTAAYVDATFTSFSTCSPTVNCTGNELPYAPKVTAAFTVDYSVPLGGAGGRLVAFGEYSYHGPSWSDVENDPTFQHIPGREVVNARIGYASDHSTWGADLWARNLFNSDAVALQGRDFLGNEFIRRIDPRTYGLELRYSFR